MVRSVLNAVPIAVLLLAAVALTIAVVVGALWLVRRTVPATREGFHELPFELAALIVFSSIVIVGYAVLVGSPNFWFHVLGPAAIAVVVVFSLLVLADLSYPFSGDVAIDPEPFDTGTLARFFAPSP